jgi:hypothetical protein
MGYECVIRISWVSDGVEVVVAAEIPPKRATRVRAICCPDAASASS